MNILKRLVSIFLASLMLIYACKDDESLDTNPEHERIRDSLGLTKSQTTQINEWINEVMHLYYFWEKHIQAESQPSEVPNPADYFSRFIYEEDEWSYITGNYDEVFNELQGTPKSYGYSPSFYYQDSRSYSIVMVINFVYPGTPADSAGLKRGDMVLSINGKKLTVENYQELYSAETQRLSIGKFNEEKLSFNYTGESIQLTKQVITTNPIIAYKTYRFEKKNIAYLAYMKFLEGENGKFLDSLDKVFQKFISDSVSELVLDLRYNPGGSISSATYLASSIVPSQYANENEKLVNITYNEGYENFLRQQEDGEEELAQPFRQVSQNMNLEKVYFLTTDRTASASELVMVGLKPYMDVVIIGEQTVGKYFGSSPFYDTNTPRRHDYVMLPIILKYENIEGYPTGAGGLVPDHEISDPILHVKPLGDTADPLISKALNLSGLKRHKAAIQRLPVFRLKELEALPGPLNNLLIDNPGLTRNKE